MERRLFLTGLVGLAGTAAVASLTRPARALVPAGNGILDEIDAIEPDVAETDEPQAEVEDIRHRRGHRRRRRRRRRRRVWRRHCRRVRRYGRWRRRCYRRRVWITIYL